MRRSYRHINRYLREIQGDVYPQPSDELQARWMYEVLDAFLPKIEANNVLDVGCGDGLASMFFADMKIHYTGIALGRDVKEAQKQGRNVIEMDFNFLRYEDDTFDLIFARHALEHSPMPLLTLMEWHRVAKKNMILVMPTPSYWGYIGRNHYAVMHTRQIRWLLRRAGWKSLEDHHSREEIRFLCEKKPRISCEGWAEAPLSHDILNSDRSR